MSMVVCVHCKCVVFAYDHETRPIAGILNLLNMVCPKCGSVHSLDGWDGDLSWESMHRIAEVGGYAWEPDGENRWFGDLTGIVADLCTQSPLTRSVLQQAFESFRTSFPPKEAGL